MFIANDMAAVLRSWLPEGRARRLTTLFGDFFNAGILQGRRRTAAVSFERWALRELDSFHALQPLYRTFNEHAGRHIHDLLRRIDEPLRPFAMPGPRDSGAVGVLSTERNERDRQLFRLYLGVLAHELGMFPFAGESFDELGANALRRIRKTHAPRGRLRLAVRDL